MVEEVDGPLSEYASGTSVENIYIFIADSTRADSLPRAVEARGVSGRAIAPSTFTASSLPSLLSGEYPATHRIWEFDDALDREPILLRECPNTGFSAETIWTHLEPEEKPPLRMVRTDSGDSFEEIAKPFVFVEHDKGGHTPYGRSFADCESTEAFYRENVTDSSQIPEYYQEGVARAADRFLDRVRSLEARGLLEDTLVVFTSDHGEHLGESKYGTVYEHGTPMTPELLSVPMVFLGAGLPADVRYSGLLSGIDLVPTALGAQDRPVPSSLAGFDLWNDRVPDGRTARAEMWKDHEVPTVNGYDLRFLNDGDWRPWRSGDGQETTLYGATSVWSDTGGHVFHRGSALARAAFGLYWHAYAAPQAEIRSRSLLAQLRLLRTYAPPTRSYGTPMLSREQARERLPGPFTKRESDVEEYTREQLEKLGYR